jgi:methionyl-tRNA formyltransferase
VWLDTIELILTKFMKRSTLVFLSSADISIPLIEAILSDQRFELKALICQPDRPAGRGQALKMPAPKKLLLENSQVPVFQPESLNDDEALISKLADLEPDFLLTFAYGQILKEQVLQTAGIEALNIHTSLLPQYRGASPIQSSLLNGDDETGISLIRMVKRMDAGPVFSMHKHKISDDETAGQLHDALAKLAAETILDSLHLISNGTLVAKVQDETRATYCSKISKDDAFLDFNESANDILAKHRAYHPWPMTWTTHLGKRLKLTSIKKHGVQTSHEPGQITCSDGRMFVSCADSTAIEVLELQLEGKKAMSAEAFMLGQAEFCQDRLPS